MLVYNQKLEVEVKGVCAFLAKMRSHICADDSLKKPRTSLSNRKVGHVSHDAIKYNSLIIRVDAFDDTINKHLTPNDLFLFLFLSQMYYLIRMINFCGRCTYHQCGKSEDLLVLVGVYHLMHFGIELT